MEGRVKPAVCVGIAPAAERAQDGSGSADGNIPGEESVVNVSQGSHLHATWPQTGAP